MPNLRFVPFGRWSGIRPSGKNSLFTIPRRTNPLSSPKTTFPRLNLFVSFGAIPGAPLNFLPVQLLGDDPFDVCKATIEKYLTVADKDKQRGAAELLAGMLSGERSCDFMMAFMTYANHQASKHWSVEKQTKMWDWFAPNMASIFKQNIKTDTLPVWTSFLEVRRDTSLSLS